MPVSRSEEENRYPVAPPDLRCKRTDGKLWQCKGWRIHEKQYCQKHYFQIVLKYDEERKSPTPVSTPRDLKKRTESSKPTSRKGGGFAVGKPKKVGLSSGGRRDKSIRGRESEASSSEEVLPKKKPRSKMFTVEDNDKEQMDEDDDDEEQEKINLGKNGKKSDEKVTKTGRLRNGESDEEGGRGNVVKSGKKAGKSESLRKKKKAERNEESDENEERANFAKSDERSGKNVSLMKQKELERKDDSDEDVGSFLKRAKRSSKMLRYEKTKVLRDEGSDDHEEEGDNVLKIYRMGGKIELGRKKNPEVNDKSEEEEDQSRELVKRRGGVKYGNKKNKVVQNCRSEEAEEERHNVVKSAKMKGKIDVGKKENADGSEMSDEEEERNKLGKSGERYSELEYRWKGKEVQSSEETEEEEVERGRELTRAQNSGGGKWGNNKGKVLRNDQSVSEGGTLSTGRGNRSGSIKQGKRKKSGWEATSDEEEEGKANVERIDKKRGRLNSGKKKEKLERDDVSNDAEEERSAVKSDECTDELVTDMKRQKIQSNESGCEEDERDGVAESVEKDDEIGLGKTQKTFLETEVLDEEEKGIENLKGQNRTNLIKASKTKGLRTIAMEMGIKSLLDEHENFGNGNTNDTAQDGDINDAKKKSQLRGKSKEIDEEKADRDSEDGGEENSQSMQKSNEVKKEEIEGYDGDLKPEADAFLKREDKKLKEKGGSRKMLKFEKEERSGQEGTVDGENVGSLFRATKKAKKTVKVDSPSAEKRKGLKINNIGEIKEEVVDNSDECSKAVHSDRERRKNSGPKVDLRRKYFSIDDPQDDCQMCHQCQYSNRIVVRCRKERASNNSNRRYCETCIKNW